MTKKTSRNRNIEIIGARVNNLKNISAKIPHKQMTVFTGPSGSGKTSMVFDVIYAEAYRRYMSTLESSFVRNFVPMLEKPDVDEITGLQAVICIGQELVQHRTSRSTVGTLTEIYTLLRLLYARIAEAHSYKTGKRMIRLSYKEIEKQLWQDFKGDRLTFLAPLKVVRKGLLVQLGKRYEGLMVNGERKSIKANRSLTYYDNQEVALIVAEHLEVTAGQEHKIKKAIQEAMNHGKGVFGVKNKAGKVTYLSRFLMEHATGLIYPDPSPVTFSFNTKEGACPKCEGKGEVKKINLEGLLPNRNQSIAEGGIPLLGPYRHTSVFKKIQATLKLYGYTLSTPIGEISAEVLELLLFGKNKTTEDPYNLKLADLLIEKIGGHKKEEEAIILEQCPACQGRRLHRMALHFKILGKNIAELCEMNLTSLQTWCQDLPKNLPSRQRQISQQIGDEIGKRIRLLIDIGLHYLHLGKSLRGLSSGEIRRIRIAKQIGTQNSHLRGVTYILDEPSLALHPRDNERIIQGLKKLRDRGNTVIVIEHDADIIEMADHLIELGPGAGRCGGEIIAKGAPKDFLEKQTPTALLLKEREQPSPIKRKRRKATGGVIAMTGCSGFPLKNINPSFPLGTLIAITGVSASGKSTLFKTLAMAIKTTLKQKTKPGFPYKKIIGAETINQVIEVSQNTISRSKRSNIATYIQLFNLIRNLFAEIPEAKIRGYKPRHFSFNTKGGRCEECKGMGDQSVDFEAMPGTKIRCEVCEGKGYQEEILGVRYKGKSIYDVLQMNVAEGVTFFKHHPYILKKLSTLMEVGLGYIQIGQDANSLSGGEAQRVKLARELSKKPKGRVLYMFDEPTANLHAQDVALLVNTMQQLVDKGNTIVCIEHNLDLIKVSDYVIDLGPEAAERGGSIVAQGTPEEVAKISKSHTGRFLKKLLGK